MVVSIVCTGYVGISVGLEIGKGFNSNVKLVLGFWLKDKSVLGELMILFARSIQM